MASERDLQAFLLTDRDVLFVQVLANDPRSQPTEAIVIGGPADGCTLSELESLPGHLRDECNWGLGYEEQVTRTGGGIGAEGATVLSLVLGVVGAVPTVAMLFDRLRRQVPDCPEHDDALETATWAVALQYQAIKRRELVLIREARHRDHWTFSLRTADARDNFEVDVYGSRSNTVATRVVWADGEAWGRRPGTAGPA